MSPKFVPNVSAKVFLLVIIDKGNLSRLCALLFVNSSVAKPKRFVSFATVSFAISSARSLIHFRKQCNKLSQNVFLTNNILHQTSHLQPSFWNFVCQPRTLFQDEVFLPSRGALTIKNETQRMSQTGRTRK